MMWKSGCVKFAIAICSPWKSFSKSENMNFYTIHNLAGNLWHVLTEKVLKSSNEWSRPRLEWYQSLHCTGAIGHPSLAGHDGTRGGDLSPQLAVINLLSIWRPYYQWWQDKLILLWRQQLWAEIKGVYQQRGGVCRERFCHQQGCPV